MRLYQAKGSAASLSEGSEPSPGTYPRLPVDRAGQRRVENGMAKDYSWDIQGREYVELYRRLSG